MIKGQCIDRTGGLRWDYEFCSLPRVGDYVEYWRSTGVYVTCKIITVLHRYRPTQEAGPSLDVYVELTSMIG
jgi:hypothetical protein